MSLTTTKKISLDFYNNNIVTVNAKQLDTEARYINITCTNHGKKVNLNCDTMRVFVRYKKSDNNICFNDGIILEDGTVDIKLTQQMLAVTGKQTVDIIVAVANGINTDNLVDINSLSDFNVTIISTMVFYVNVQATAVDNSSIASESEFDALDARLIRLVGIETHIDNVISECETATINANDAAKKVDQSIDNCEAIILSADEKIQEMDIEIKDCKLQKDAAELAATKANYEAEECRLTTENAEDAIDETIKATENANAAATECRTLINESNLIYQTEKGVANGVATLDENGQVPSSQLNIADNLTTGDSGLLLDASQGKILNDTKLSLDGGEMTGDLSVPNINVTDNAEIHSAAVGLLVLIDKNKEVVFDVKEELDDLKTKISNLYNYSSCQKIGVLDDGTAIYKGSTRYLASQLIKQEEGYQMVKFTPSVTFKDIYSYNAYLLNSAGNAMYPLPYYGANGELMTYINKI